MNRRNWTAGPLLAALGLWGCGEASLVERRHDFETTEELLAAAHGLAPGDVVTHRGAGLVIPDPDQAVFTEVMFEDGDTQQLNLELDAQGKVEVVLTPVEEEVGATDEGAGTGTMEQGLGGAACRDGAWSLKRYHWRGRVYEWFLNAATTPRELTAAQAEQHIREATDNVTHSRNDCGLSDAVGARHRYRGRTRRGTQVSVSGTCLRPDGVSVTAFGDLPAGVLAVTCTWYSTSTGLASESDVIINKADHAWTVAANSPSCRGRFGLEAVMTHERGHTFGLGHVSEASHPTLTMSERIAPCDASANTLGLGDVRALRRRY